MAQPTISTFDSGSTTNASDANNDYFTTSKTFVTGHLYVLFLFLTSAASAPADPAVTMTTGADAWTKGRSRQDTTNHVNGSYWYILRTSDVTSTVKIDGAAAMTGWDWIIVDVTGFYDSGTLSQTFPQSNDNQATSATPSVALGSAPTSGNRTLGAILAYANQAITQGANFTEVVETGGHANPTVRAELERDTSAVQQTMDWSMTSAGYMAIGVEIKAQAILPAALALTLTAVAPQVNQAVAPAALALTLTAVAPDIQQASGNQTVSPAALALTLTAVAPQVAQQVAPAALSLTLTPVAPSVAQSVSPAVLGLTVAFPAPSVAQQVAPAALALTLTPVAPQVKQAVNPAALALTLTPVAPTLTQAGFVAVPVLALTLTPVAPQIAQQVVVGVIPLVVTPVAPAAVTQSVSPDPLALTLVAVPPENITFAQKVFMPALALTIRLRRLSVHQTPPGNIDVDFGDGGSSWATSDTGPAWSTSDAGAAWQMEETEA